MNRRERAFAKSDAEFKELFGVKKETFNQMAEVLAAAEQQRHAKGGRPSKLSIDDQLLLTLQYLREYRTMAHLAFDFGIAKSTVYQTIIVVENILIQDDRFHLPGKKALLDKENEGRTFAVDATESPVQRPKKKKKQKKHYSGKKKQHTQKTQIIIDVESQKIICTDQAPGCVHDFTLFKLAMIAILKGILLLADSGYQGLLDLHKNSKIPYKKSKNHPLTAEQKQFNRELSKERIVVENVNAKIKTFKIMSERYRNHRKRHLLRMNLICAIHNFELSA